MPLASIWYWASFLRNFIPICWFLDLFRAKLGMIKIPRFGLNLFYGAKILIEKSDFLDKFLFKRICRRVVRFDIIFSFIFAEYYSGPSIFRFVPSNNGLEWGSEFWAESGPRGPRHQRKRKTSREIEILQNYRHFIRCYFWRINFNKEQHLILTMI